MSPPADDVVTLAVLGERMTNLTTAVDKLTISVDLLGAVTGKVKNLEGRLSVLEQWHTWLLRTVFAVIVVAVLGTITVGATVLQR